MKQTRSALLKWMARSLVKIIPMGEAVADFATDVLPVMTSDVYDWWTKDASPEERRKELEALAQANPEEAKAAADAAVEEARIALGDEATPERLEAVRRYLEQVPDAIRRSMRRPDDSSGRTVPPHLAPRTASELGALMPQRTPKFNVGDRPIPGVDLELVSPLGVGGFGEVWRARKTHLGQDVALKFCLDPTASVSLRNETSLLRRLMSGDAMHPGIVRLLATYNDCTALEYEFVEGGDLAGLIKAWHGGGKRPTPKLVIEAVRQISEIVAFAHQLEPPLVHRDLKPANILVQRKADGHLRFRLTDFGIGGMATARQVAATQRSKTGDTSSTSLQGSYSFLYASPQQMRAERPDPTDDVYSLGVIFWQLANGDLASGAPGGMQWAKEMQAEGYPEGIVSLLGSCFDLRADHRPKTAAVFAAGLRESTPPQLRTAVTPANVPPTTGPIAPPAPTHAPNEPERRAIEVSRVRADLRQALAAAPIDSNQARAIANRLLSLVPQDDEARAAFAKLDAQQRVQAPPSSGSGKSVIISVGLIVGVLSICGLFGIIGLVTHSGSSTGGGSGGSGGSAPAAPINPMPTPRPDGDQFVEWGNDMQGAGVQIVVNHSQYYVIYGNGARYPVSYDPITHRWQMQP